MTTLTATTDKQELKMKMKIAEYYVSLTGIFGRQVTWNSHHRFWRETCGSLETTRKLYSPHTQQSIHRTSSAQHGSHRTTDTLKVRPACTMELKVKMVRSYWWFELFTQHEPHMLIKTARVLRDSDHIDCHYWQTRTENENENSWILWVTHWLRVQEPARYWNCANHWTVML